MTHLIDRLHTEHGGLLDRVRDLASGLAGAAATDAHEAAVRLRPGADSLAHDLGLHAALEDDALFPVLEAELRQRGDIELTMFRDDHAQVRACLDVIARAVLGALPPAPATLRAAAESAGRLLELCEDHFRREEEARFPVAREVLVDSEWVEIDRRAREVIQTALRGEN